jgi:hypothetical protein
MLPFDLSFNYICQLGSDRICTIHRYRHPQLLIYQADSNRLDLPCRRAASWTAPDFSASKITSMSKNLHAETEKGEEGDGLDMDLCR